jgi:hypothetical protein
MVSRKHYARARDEVRRRREVQSWLDLAALLPKTPRRTEWVLQYITTILTEPPPQRRPVKRHYLHGKLICGATRKRDGKPCESKRLLRGGRCRFHGGMSTGPRTDAGKARALANLRQYRSNASS